MEKLLSKEKVSKKVKDWTENIIQIKSQLDHTREKAVDAFEKQKNYLRNWSKKVERELHKLEGLSEEKANQFKVKLKDFRVQLALGKAETEVILKEQQKKINQAIKELKQSITGLSKNPEGQGNFWEKVIQRLDDYQMRFDLFKLQLDLGKKEGQQHWMEKKKEINSKLQEIEFKLKKGKGLAFERLVDFSEEISESWERLKKTISN